jgi:transposase
MVADPKAIKHFAVASMQRTKTDLMDASLILEYLRRMNFVKWIVPSDNSLKIQSIARRMFQLKNEKIRENNRRHAGSYADVSAGLINNDIEVNIRHITKRIDLLESKALQIIRDDNYLNKLFELLISIPGIANTSAIKILAEIICLPADISAKQWIAYAGLEPRTTDLELQSTNQVELLNLVISIYVLLCLCLLLLP